MHLSMPQYVPEALKRFDHPPPETRKDQPYPHIPPIYGARVQYAKAIDGSTLLNVKGKKYIMCVTRTFHFYSRAIDITTIPDLISISLQ